MKDPRDDRKDNDRNASNAGRLPSGLNIYPPADHRPERADGAAFVPTEATSLPKVNRREAIKAAAGAAAGLVVLPPVATANADADATPNRAAVSSDPTPYPPRGVPRRLWPAHEAGSEWGGLGLGLAFGLRADHPYDLGQRVAFTNAAFGAYRRSQVIIVSVSCDHPIAAMLGRLTATVANLGFASDDLLAAEHAAHEAMHRLAGQDPTRATRPINVRVGGRWYVAMAIGRCFEASYPGHPRGVSAIVGLPGMGPV